MRAYDLSLPTAVLFGINRIDSLGSIIAERTDAKRVALFSVSEEWMRPVLARITGSLEAAGLELAVTFSAIHGNPKLSECREGLTALERSGATVIIAIGGGSYLDASKWIAARAHCDLFITIPTTAGTGSEINEWAVITNDETHVKESVQCKAADVAILDPSVTVAMTPLLTLNTGMDAFSHGLEAYLSVSATLITDLLAFEACSTIISNISSCLIDGNDLQARGYMLEASMMAGVAMLNAGLGVLHCIANILPGFYPAYSHGFVCGSLISEALEYNRPAVPVEKYLRVQPLVEQAGEIFKKFISDNGVAPVPLSRDNLSHLVYHASMNVNGRTNPRRITESDVEGLIRKQFPVS
jgi:alcohol dehydrogenase class IV